MMCQRHACKPAESTMSLGAVRDAVVILPTVTCKMIRCGLMLEQLVGSA